MRVDPDALYAAYRSVTLDDPDGDRSLFLDLPSEPPSVTVQTVRFESEWLAPVIPLRSVS
jgi:hypothetical protein